jgi:hypothetical protein
LIGYVRFRFYKPETEKAKPNPNWKKLSRTGNQAKPETKPNRKKLSQTGKNQAKFVLKYPNRNQCRFGFIFFL